MILPAPHPRCVVIETFQCSYLGMGHSLLWRCFSDVPGNVVVFPTHNSKVVQGDFMACCVVMVHDGWWWPHVFPVPFTKGSARLTNIFFSTVYPSTTVLVDYSTFLQYGVLVLRMYQDISDGPTTLEVDFYTISSADVFAWFCQSFHVGYHNEWLVVVSGPLVGPLLFLLEVCSVPGPYRDICIFWGLWRDGLLLFPMTVLLCIQFWPCVWGCWWHCILQPGGDSCSNANTCLYGLVFYRQLSGSWDGSWGGSPSKLVRDSRLARTNNWYTV